MQKGSYNNRNYVYNVTFTGYHYPTLADLLTQVTAVESSVTDLQVALCELYEEKGRKNLMAKTLCSPDPQGVRRWTRCPPVCAAP